MLQFAHLSDPHLSSLEAVRLRALRPKQWLGYLSWRRRRRAEHRRELLDVLTEDLLAQPLAQIVLTGDLTHIGLEAEFEHTAAWLSQLAAPEQVTLVPGNHDATLTGSIPLQRRYWAAYLGAGFPSLRVRDGVAFIGVDSAIASAPLLAVGEVGAAQRAQLAALLEQCADRGLFRVLCLHHCPLPGADKPRKRLRDAAAVHDILVDKGVELVLHGHNHRSRQRMLSTRMGEAPVLCAPSASARGHNGHEPGGYHLLRLEPCAGGWTLQWQKRALASNTRVVSADHGSFSLPRAHAP